MGRVLVQRGVDVRAPMVVMGVLSARSTSHQCGLLESRPYGTTGGSSTPHSPLLRGMFGSAGVPTWPAGCSEARHGSATS